MSQWLTVSDDDWPVWTIAPTEQHMAGPDDDKPDDDTDDTDDDTSGDDDGDKSGDDDGPDDDNEKDVSKLRERMKAADRRASQLQRERDELARAKKEREDAEKGDLEKATERVAELESQLAKHEAENKRLRVENAFFAVNDVDWVDPSEALGALDLDDVEINDEGKVNTKQLKSAIKALRERKGHWVKSDSSTEAGGSKMNGKRKGEQESPDAAKMAERFPALRNRSL